ncbi:MAG: glycosyltransferase family 39 protein [Nanoarchaeota archaeon]|nr:glycosyltransferase family 39 protein [Nanoarchaeota archaeon]
MEGLAFLKKNWYLILLLFIVIMAFTIRAAPARYNELQALDPFYLYRISDYVLTHNFQLPEVDTLRNHPYGDTQFDLLVMHYLPPLMYVALNPIMQISFFNFALLYPAIMGALSVLVMFFLAKEIFGDTKAGLFAAFFLATVQAFITRTSAGFFEKEPTSSVFMFLSVFLFVKSFKSKDWRYGILSGIMLGLMTLSWGGSQYIYILFAVFILIMSVINYDTKAILYSYAPTALFGIFMPLFIQPRIVSLLSTTTILALGVLGIIVLRYLVEKFKIVKHDQAKFATPAILIIGIVVFLIGTMFIDLFYSILQGIISIATLQPTTTTTVAESIGGSWDVVVSQTSLGAALGGLGPLASLSPIFSLWTFSILGLIVVIYKIYRTKNVVLIMPIIWLLLAIFGVFFAIRLIYFMGPTVALLAGFLLAWLINKSGDIKIINDVKKTWQIFLIVAAILAAISVVYIFSSITAAVIVGITAITLFIFTYIKNISEKDSIFTRIYLAITRQKEKAVTIVTIPVIIIVIFSLSFNAINGYTYSQFLGPSINQYWYEAMDYMRVETPQNSSLLSWWDFGYWFQTRGERSTIADGGGVGNTSRFDIAIWFTADSQNWTDFEPWLIDKLDVDYILMDYTLPGKYGAITKIASHETTVVGIMQVQQTGTIPQGNSTVYEFRTGPYVIWLPIEGGAVSSSPMFLIAQGEQYSSQSYINDICTVQGIVHVGDNEPAIGGCVAITNAGVYYVPEEAKRTIFTNLMFMDAYGLPVEKVFDNTLIKIYKVSNNPT